ncbi:MAG TPA: hypothetical protein VHL54_07315 [Actinomycetota bacterium]|nr:hypothetical protein [Actinomycetota bacterium]
MTDFKIPIYLEIGRKRTFACSLEWPGWCRSGRTEEAAIDALIDIAPRYAEVARSASRRFPKAERDRIEVVERIPGSGTTDFGAPGKVAQADYEELDQAAAGRLRDLLRASWDLLDRAVAEASPTLQKGPRGGGRDRDDIFRHVLAAETAYARSAGLKLKEPDAGDRRAIEAHREAILDIVRPASDTSVRSPKGWPIRYAVRRCAWHVLDHAWEIQDKSLKG